MSRIVEHQHPNHAFIEMVEMILEPHCSTRNELTLIRNKLLKAGLGSLNQGKLRVALQERLFKVGENDYYIRITMRENLGKHRSQVVIAAFNLTLPKEQ